VRNLFPGEYTATATAPDRLLPPVSFTLPGPAEVVLARVWTGSGPAPATAAGFVHEQVQYYRAVTGADGRARVLAAPGTALVGFSGEWELRGGEPEPQIVHTTAGVPTAVTLRRP
jgi:hypothetical protein